MASSWVEDGELTDWEGSASADDDGQTGTPLPYVDPEVAAELAGEVPPVWMGTRWREIEAEHQWEAWNTLRRWVDWFVAEYRLVTSVVPRCWYKHSDLTAELYAANVHGVQGLGGTGSGAGADDDVAPARGDAYRASAPHGG